MDMYMNILSSTSEVVEAPEYIKVLPLGYVYSEKGNFVVDKESFISMKEHMQKRNIDIVMDYEHQTLNNTQAPASGWISQLILKENGIFAKVRWTENAKQYLKNKEYRYLSPVVMVNQKNNKALQLHSVALTNTPAINGMTPIVNSVNIPNVYGGNQELSIEEMEILKALNISKEEFKRYGLMGGDNS